MEIHKTVFRGLPVTISQLCALSFGDYPQTLSLWIFISQTSDYRALRWQMITMANGVRRKKSFGLYICPWKLRNYMLSKLKTLGKSKFNQLRLCVDGLRTANDNLCHWFTDAFAISLTITETVRPTSNFANKITSKQPCSNVYSRIS